MDNWTYGLAITGLAAGLWLVLVLAGTWEMSNQFFFTHFIIQQAQRQNAINLINVKETVITDTYLMYQTYPQTSPDSHIIFTLISPPKSGVLLLSSSGKDLLSNAAPVALKLRSGLTFNQVDLLSGHLKYKLTTMSQHKSLDDTFSFRVSIKSEGKIISPIEVCNKNMY